MKFKTISLFSLLILGVSCSSGDRNISSVASDERLAEGTSEDGCAYTIRKIDKNVEIELKYTQKQTLAGRVLGNIGERAAQVTILLPNVDVLIDGDEVEFETGGHRPHRISYVYDASKGVLTWESQPLGGAHELFAERVVLEVDPELTKISRFTEGYYLTLGSRNMNPLNKFFAGECKDFE